MIHVKDLWAGYREDEPVLRGISFTFDKGFLVVLGPNGAGKTTLLSVLTGFLGRSKGECRVLGRDCGSLIEGFSELVVAFEKPPRIRQKVSEIYSTLCSFRSCDKDLFYSFLERFGLRARDTAGRDLARLSAGEKMKTYLSMLLSIKAKLYILDEPNSNLDPRSRAILREILLEKSGSSSFLVTTHVYEYVEDAATHVAIIKDGRLVLYDRLEDALKKYVGNSCIARIRVGKLEEFIKSLQAAGLSSYRLVSRDSIMIENCKEHLNTIAGLPGIISLKLASLESLYKSIAGEV